MGSAFLLEGGLTIYFKNSYLIICLNNYFILILHYNIETHE